MRTDGVMVWKAACKKVKPECTAVGKFEQRWRNVEYEAMIIGGNGGNAGCKSAAACAAAAAASEDGR